VALQQYPYDDHQVSHTHGSISSTQPACRPFTSSSTPSAGHAGCLVRILTRRPPRRPPAFCCHSHTDAAASHGAAVLYRRRSLAGSRPC
jgi:hypothetical protein